MMTQTFNDEAAGAALSRLARARAGDPSLVSPADVCLYAWLVAEAARQGSTQLALSITQIFEGYTDERGEVAKVGLSQNTIRAGLAELTSQGFLTMERGKALRGGGNQWLLTIPR